MWPGWGAGGSGVRRRGWGPGGGTLGINGSREWWEVGTSNGLLEKMGWSKKAPRCADSEASMSSEKLSCWTTMLILANLLLLVSFLCLWVTLVHWYQPLLALTLLASRLCFVVDPELVKLVVDIAGLVVDLDLVRLVVEVTGGVMVA